MMLVGFYPPVRLREQLLLLRGLAPMMMLVGLYLPVCLGVAVIVPKGEPPQYNASRFFSIREVIGSVIESEKNIKIYG